MKKLIYTFALAVFMLASCNNDEVTIQPEATKALTPEQQKMRSALETTTNILLNMIANDQTYLEELNKVIVAGSPEYLEDRVMLKDLFYKASNSSALRVKANTNKFTSDFKTAFCNNRPQKIGGLSDVNSDTFSNPDSLILFLTKNNFSLYCPYPLEDYDEGNRIPAITFKPIDNDSVNIGYLLDKTGNFSIVQVSQEYADEHPVWIIMPNEEAITSENSNIKISKAMTDAPTNGFEVDIKKIYCTEYYGWIFHGDLDIVFMRSKGATLNMSTWRFEGTFDVLKTLRLPRKYVGYAKDGKESGWYTVNYIWDYEWDNLATEQVLTVFEHDKVKSTEFKATAKRTLGVDITIAPGVVLKAGEEVGVEYKSTYNSQDEPITIETVGRNKFYQIVKDGHKDSSGNHDWYWGKSSTNIQHDGRYIYRANASCQLTFDIVE